MRRICLILFTLVVSAALFAGCSDKAKELYETARLEELQRNHSHARELYRRILDSHPGSEYAPMARERMAELDAERRERP